MNRFASSQKKVTPEKAASADAAMDYIALLLARREYSEYEVRSRLNDRGYTARTVAQAITRAVGCGLIDDQRFAQRFIKSKISAGIGKYRIEQELRLKGINAEGVEGYPEAFYSEVDELENALSVLSRFHTRSKNQYQAAFRHLVGKGYSSSLAQAALRAHSEQSADSY